MASKLHPTPRTAARLIGEGKKKKGEREERVQLKHKLEMMLNPEMKMMREGNGR